MLQLILLDDDENEDIIHVPPEMSKWMPETALLDYFSQLTCIMNLSELYDTINLNAEFYHYDENIWPLPFDYLPEDVFDNGKYDINLTFGQTQKPTK